jgi:sodium/potassium-transporting ATPase subunit alpha
MLLMSKGAPDVLLPRCSSYINARGDRLALDSAALACIVKLQESWASKGQRVLLLAKRVIPSTLKVPPTDEPEFTDYVMTYLHSDLTIVGLVGLVDPPRPDIPRTVATMRGAGIRFCMVTGDFATTALAIAEQCGIVTNAAETHRLADLDRNANPEDVAPFDRDGPVHSLVLSGSDLMEMNDTQWARACAYHELVFARTTPEQKLRIVKEFQKRGCVVGMTGDGVNDAPSLKAADIGIAMGGGSDVAMEAADLVLLDS